MTLIELILAVLIGLLILSALTEIYIANQKSLRIQTALYNIQNDGQTASSILSSEIHQAGMIGCAKLANDFPITAYHEYSLTANNKLVGNNQNELTVRYSEYPNNYLITDMLDNSTIHADQTVKFKLGDILLISNCKQAELFIVDKVKTKKDSQLITTLNPLRNKYEKFSEVSKFKVNKFFIKKTHHTHIDGTPVYSLFLEDINHQKTELVMDVNQMQIKYTINNSGNWLYVSANQVTDWSKVVGVGIDLELNSPPIKKICHLYSALQVYE